MTIATFKIDAAAWHALETTINTGHKGATPESIWPASEPLK